MRAKIHSASFKQPRGGGGVTGGASHDMHVVPPPRPDADLKHVLQCVVGDLQLVDVGCCLQDAHLQGQTSHLIRVESASA
jgi:hypothetical protein